jgi:hypothetical protein
VAHNRSITLPPVTFDAWIDGDDVVRRLSWEVNVEAVGMAGRFDVAPGAPVPEVAPPPAADTYTALNFEMVLRMLGFGG